MRRIATWLAGTLALAACADAEPVDETEPTPVASEALPEAVVDRRLPSRDASPTPGSGGALAQGQWFAKTERGVPMALFGPPQSEAVFSIRCDEGELVFARSVMARGDSVTMDLEAGGETRTIVATPQQDPLPRVTGSLLADDPFVEFLATTTQPIAVRVGDGPSLRIPPHDHLRELAANCGN